MKKLTGSLPLAAARNMPSQTYASPSPIETRIAMRGLFTSRVAVAAGPTRRVNTSKAPMTWMERETVTAMIAMKRTERNRTGTPRASAAGGSNVLKRSGPIQEHDHGKDQAARHRGHPDRLRADPEDVSEENPVHPGGVARVQGEKQQPQPEGEGHDDPDGNVALPDILSHEAHDHTGAEGESEKAEDRLDAEENGPCRAGKTDIGQRMTGECQPPRDEEVPACRGDRRLRRRR